MSLLNEHQLTRIEHDPRASSDPWSAAAIDALVANVRTLRDALTALFDYTTSHTAIGLDDPALSVRQSALAAAKEALASRERTEP